MRKVSKISKATLLVSICLGLMFNTVGCSKTQSKPTEPAKTTESAKTADQVKTWKPEKMITLIVPAGAGGTTDIMGRIIEKVWPKYVPDVKVTVVNKPGGGGVIGSMEISKSKPDGYTFGVGLGQGCDIVLPHIDKAVEYDSRKDLLPVALLTQSPVLIAASAESGLKSMQDVVDWSKKTGKTVVGSNGNANSLADVILKYFGKKAGINVTSVPYTSAPATINAVLGGDALIAGAQPGDVKALVKGGKLVVLGIDSKEPNKNYPGVKTFIEQGYDVSTPGFQKGVALPPQTPKEIVQFYDEIFKKISADEEFVKLMTDADMPVKYIPNKDYPKFFLDSYNEFGTILKEAGFAK
jgi:tripartite-type tricarboxylate transporter receptor subunit TctC